MKRISMAGADVAVTDERLAALVLEYAKELGRAGTTDTITLPVADSGRPDQASMLLGPSSQIAVTPNHDLTLETVPLPGVDEVLADLQARLDRLTGRAQHPVLHEDPEAAVFPDFEDFGA
ncbi:MAG: hypothetical protein ACTHJL_02475 [Amnibacterium sp.]